MGQVPKSLRRCHQLLQFSLCTMAYHSRRSQMVSRLCYCEDRRQGDGRDETGVAEAQRRFVEDKNYVSPPSGSHIVRGGAVISLCENRLQKSEKPNNQDKDCRAN